MKIELSVTGLKELREGLSQFSDRRFNATLATALTRTAVAIRDEGKKELGTSFDRPTPYTRRQLRFVPARADRLVAAVGFNVSPIQDVFGNVVRYEDLGPGNTPAGKYITPGVQGGDRRLKRFERALQIAGAMPQGWQAVPGDGAKIDQFGNMSVGQIKQILSHLGAASIVAGSTQNSVVRQLANKMRSGQKLSKEERARLNRGVKSIERAGGTFFVVMPGAKSKLLPGVYQREFAGRNITPVLIYVRDSNYKKRFDFDALAARIRDERLPAEVKRAVGEQLERLKARGAA